MEPENPVWLGEYVWEETPLDGGPPKAGPLPAEVLSMFRPQHCLLCGITTANMQTAYTHYESKGHFKKVTHHMREKFNALGSLKTNKEKFQTVVCDICNVELTSRIVYLQHYDGKQHLKNLKKRGFKPPPTEEVILGDIVPPASDPDAPAKDPPPPLPKVGDYVCALCNVSTATKAQMHVHNNGSRHMKNVAKLADGELRDFYMKNGNCEPTGNNEEGAKDGVTDQNSAHVNQSGDNGGYNGGYVAPGQPMDPSMMQQYPQQMPYGSYPQYPMPYDFNSWGQPNMYANYSAAYNGQYGAGYGQQYPSYGYPQAPAPEFFNQQQGFNPGQQYPGQFPGPQQFGQFNPEQYNQQYQQQYSQQDYQNQPNYSENDPRNQSRNSRTGEPDGNEPPEGVKPKSLGVGDFQKQWAQDPNDDRPPGVDGPPGIDKSDDLFGSLSDDLRIFKSKNAEKVLADDFSNSKGDENARKPKRAKKDRKKDKTSGGSKTEGVTDGADDIPGIGVSESATDLPPIPGLDITPVDPKPTIITWSEGNEDEDSDAEDTREPLGMEGITLGGVEPPPPHPLNPPIHFLPPSPDSEPPPVQRAPAKIEPPVEKSTEDPQPERQASPEKQTQELVDSANSVQPYSQATPNSEMTYQMTSSESTYSQAAMPNAESAYQVTSSQSTYSQAPMPNTESTYQQVTPSHATYSQAPMHDTDSTYQHVSSGQSTYSNPNYSQAPMPSAQSAYQVTSSQPQSYSQSMYPSVPNYNLPYISNPPVSYSQGPVANYPSMYPHVSAANTQPYQVPAPLPQTFPSSVQSVPQNPPIPPLPSEPEKPAAPAPAPAPTPAVTQSSPVQSTEEVTTDTAKEDDPKSTSNKPKINSFFRRAAEKMFKEAKEKKLKEEAKQVEKDPSKAPEPAKKSGKDTIIIVPPINGPKSAETADNTAPPGVVNVPKPRALESVSETDNDVGSEPGEIVDKTPKVDKIAVKSDSAGVGDDNAKPLKSKFDFGSKKSSESRKRRSFRVRRSSASRSRSRSRSPKRRRRRSRSWSPSPEKSPVGYYQRNTFQSYYGNDSGYWRNDRGQYRSYEDWDDSRADRYERHRNDRDEFGRERKWKEEKKREERKKKKRRSRKRERSSSRSPTPRRMKETKEVEAKKEVERIPSPPTKPERPSLQENDVGVDHKPVTVSLMQRLKGSLPTSIEKPQEPSPRKDVPAKLVEKIENNVEIREILVRPDVDSDEAREVEKEEQEILKKVALIKKKLLEKDEKPPKNKKRKKDKAKRKKKRRKSTSSSDSDSSDSDSSSSSSSSSTSSSSSSSSSSTPEPKSKRIVESLISKLSKHAAAGDAKPFDLAMLPALVKKTKKADGKKKKKKKDKKRKKKKDKMKPELPPQLLSTFIDADGAYHCKCCNLTTSSGSSFIEHLISEKHKIMYKLISAK